MSEICVAPTFTEVAPEYGIFPTDPPPCLPDAVTLQALQTEDSLVLFTEDGLDLYPES